MNVDQLKAFEDRGFIFFPAYFSEYEVNVIRAELPAILSNDTHAKFFEKDGESVRIVYGVHSTNEVFRLLSLHPRLIRVAMNVLGGEVYIHQSKLNFKSAFQGSAFPWHQDYAFWHKRDGMPSANVVNAIVFLDEVSEINAPIFLLPGSHKEGLIETDGYTLDNEILRELMQKYEITSIKGLPGAVLFFHGNLVHASSVNISPFNRTLAFVTYNSINNALRPLPEPAPEYIANRDFRPLVPFPNDTVLTDRREESHSEKTRIFN